MKQTMPEIEIEKNIYKPTDSKNGRKVQPFGLVCVHGIVHARHIYNLGKYIPGIYYNNNVVYIYVRT